MKNKLNPNTAICNLNDTLETIEYILAKAEEEDDEVFELSSLTLVSSGQTSVESVDGEEIVEKFKDAHVEISPMKVPLKTGTRINFHSNFS